MRNNLLADTVKENIYAVVPAAGVGSRMGSAIPKQYLPLLGKTVLEHTLTKLLSLTLIKKIVLVVNPDDTRWQSLDIINSPRIVVTSGGVERSDSVLAGLNTLADECDANDWVLVHDVARPCVSSENINELINLVHCDDVGGILALPVTDTVKRVSESRITATIDRRQIWRAQTPQMFRFNLLLDAMSSAISKSQTITDEASAVELAGHQAKIVMGRESNIKITHTNDLSLAEFYLQRDVC